MIKDEILNITNEELDKIDLSQFKEVVSEYYKQYFYLPSGEEHYRLLIKISSFFNDTNIIDLGTHLCSSAVALSYNNSNIIHSFDIKDYDESKNIKEKLTGSNIKFYTTNILQTNQDLLLSSPLIFIDVDHNGETEKQIIECFKQNKYKGITIWDDIYLHDGMRYFWNETCKDFEKYDISHIGHWSGTGLIIFE
jgi:hypothetical protein